MVTKYILLNFIDNLADYNIANLNSQVENIFTYPIIL